jgi:hypothetical protein
MKLAQKILSRLNGLHYSQEYLCLARESFEEPLSASLIIDGQVISTITHHHCFVGYSPVLFAIRCCDTRFYQPGKISIALSIKPLPLNGKLMKKDAVALLHLEKIAVQPGTKDGETILYYEAINGEHHFLPAFHRFIIGLDNQLHGKKPGNVFLNGNRLKQVQIAYAIPRKVSLITTGNGDLYNLFPTDLHGEVDDDRYLISLRHAGEACQQVLDTRNILLTEVRTDFYKTVYALGKNHMQPMKAKQYAPFSNMLSGHFNLPLPQTAVQYRELQVLDHFTRGIHRIILFKIVNQQLVDESSSTLAHIHRLYASWRQNKQLPGNYLFR